MTFTRSRLSHLAIIFASGIGMALTTAPVNWWWLAWIAIVPLWLAILRDRQPILSGIVWGIAYHGIVLSWITGLHPMTWMGVPWLASLVTAIVCWILISLWGVAFLIVWTWIQSKLHGFDRLNDGTIVFVGVALWCVLEALWSRSPLWWTSLAFTQASQNLIVTHLGQLSGTTAVTAAIVAVNGCVALGITKWQQRRSPGFASPYFITAIVLFFCSHLLGFWLFSRPLNNNPNMALTVGIIQGNVPNEIKLSDVGYRRALENYTTGYRSLANAGVDVILTPETALPFYWEESKTRSNSPAGHLYQAILDEGAPIWLGTFGKKEGGYTNSLLYIDGNGKTIARYNKVKLVPLGEYIPLDNILGNIIDRLSPLNARLIPGSPAQTFDSPFGTAIASICYESAFSYHFKRQAQRGGELILSASNDDHYAQRMPVQHHAQDIMRAIEVDRASIRATNTGYSAIVDPHGRTLWKSAIDTYETHAATIYRRQTRTLYVRWGDWLTPVLAIGAIVGLTVAFWYN